jgi:hypothetical protein
MSAMNIDVDPATYLATAASSAPSDLQPFFEKFRTLYERRCVKAMLAEKTTIADILSHIDYGIN